MQLIPLTPTLRRLSAAAAISALVLTGCGADSGSQSSASTVPVATDATGMLAPRPVKIAGGGAVNASATPEAAPAADGRMATDMIAPYRVVTFVPGDLPALPGNDVGYVFQAGASVTAEQVAALAAGLGVVGEPVRVDDGYSVWWRVGPDDGTAPMVSVYEDAQLSWNYNAAWATQTATTGCAIAEPAVVDPAGDLSVGSDAAGAGTDAVAVAPTPIDTRCEQPAPPNGVPTADEAVARVQQLMTAVGLDPATFTFEPYADEWFASVSAVEQLDGAYAARRFDAGFGAEGVLQYASGQLAVPSQVGPYPLVDLDTAIARLNDQSGFYGGYGGGGGVRDIAVMDSDMAVARTETAPAVGAPVAVDVVEPDPGSDPAVGGSIPGESLPVAEPLPMPVDEVPVDEVPVDMPEPEAVTVTLVDVQADVWWAWDVDGTVWLLPAYRFIGDDGGWYTVPAVTDEFLVQVDQPTPEPLPADPATPPASEPGAPPVSADPGTPTEPAIFDTSQLDGSVGLALDEFTKLAESMGATVRVVERDGESLAVTADFSTSRVNVATTTGADGVETVSAIVNVG